MEQETEKTNEQQTSATADAVLKYLAENHPDDEAALERMTSLLETDFPSEALLDTLYRGLRADADATAADQAGYLRGRNEAIEMRRKEARAAYPADDGGEPTDYDLPLLRNIRRSVWD